MAMVEGLLAQAVDPGLTDACGEKPSYFCEAAWNLTENEFVARAVDWFVSRPLTALVIVGVAWILNKLLRRLVTKFIDNATSSDKYAASAFEKIGVAPPTSLVEKDPRSAARAQTLSVVLRACVSALIWTIASLMVLGVFEINLAPLLASAGIAGVAVGFGAQSLVKDCIAGFFMLLEDQFGVGDNVDLGEAAGTVESLSLRSTTLRGADGTQWHVPNGVIVRVGNRSKAWANGQLDVTVTHDADVDEALIVLKRVVEEVCGREEFATIVLEPPKVLGVESLNLDGVVLRVVVKTLAGEQWGLMRELRSAVKHEFDAADIPLKPVAPPPPRPPA